MQAVAGNPNFETARYDSVFRTDARPSSARMKAAPLRLAKPSVELLPSYVAALERGWSHDNLRGAVAAAEELAQIRKDPAAFVASLDNREGVGLVTLPDGSKVPRLPGYRRWMWDGEFAGSIGLRWQRGTAALPEYCLGHIGYAVVPWKQGLGYATHALIAMIAEARAVGLPYVEITTEVENIASRRVILKAGGVLHEEFDKPAAYGGGRSLRFRAGGP
jgi:predicted acetyltransferase